ncbi:vWA domain-containing protein [Sulfurospirillum sp. 1612]|uniref:vWA domain-containing protein n=1 Tax=Sulfurospirillum sp. 1612 TaxID=3094835 RepID=UPI002F92C926
MIEFEHLNYLWGALLLLPLFYFLKRNKNALEMIFSAEVLQKIRVKNRGLSKKMRNIMMILSLFFMIVALTRPYINNGEVKVKSSFINLVVGFDISNSMFANDIYPNRLAFAKQKFDALLKNLKNAKVGVLAFSSRAFLVAPLSEDYNSLEFLVKNMGMDNISLRGTDILSALEAAQNLYGNEEKKAFLIFTDGGDKKRFDKEIAYAKAHHIVVFIYNIGTEKGGVIKTPQGVLKDKNGNIVVVKINKNIESLALQTGGAYLRDSLSSHDMTTLSDAIKSQFKAIGTKETEIVDKKELFYYPLGVAILLFFLSIFSINRRRR